MNPITENWSMRQLQAYQNLVTSNGSLEKASEGQGMNKLSDLPQAKEHVNHPEHYKTGKFECIDIMAETQGIDAVQSFCVCNAFKYLYRHKKKNGTEDISKAIWYLNKYLELEKEKKHENRGSRTNHQ